ncbi:probable glutamate receptor [Parasteatoda tepidariorum]|uniref:probable glutamate receptor n=1 Tax=Parasteatoda tepidariorum TaxID=114398 RepID=UPI0039BCC340
MHTPSKKIITFPGNGTRYRMCLHVKQQAIDPSLRYPGPRPGFSGIQGSLLQAIAENFGVEFDYFIPNDDGFGVMLKDGSGTGCPGMVQKNETDVAMAEMLQNYWSNLFSYTTVSYRMEYLRFITKLPDPVIKHDTLIKIFDDDLWLTILFSIIIVAFISYWIHGKKYSFADHCFSRVGELLLQEPVVKIEKTYSQELLCIFWNINSLFLTLAYMAVILGVMMMPRRPPSLDTDDKLLEAVEAGKHKVMVDSEMRMFLENMRLSPVETYNRLADIMLENNWILPLNKDNFASYLKNDYAVTSAVIHRKLYGSTHPEMVISEDYIYLANLCSISSKSFPLQKKFDSILTRLVEHGIYEKELDHFVFIFRLHAIADIALDKEEVRALGLTDLEGTFMLLGFGYSISTIVLIYEILKLKITVRYKNPGFENDKRESETASHNYGSEEIT